MLNITREVYERIADTLGKETLERGGVLGAALNSDVISEYYFDVSGKSIDNGYIPDAVSINRILKDEWMPRGIIMVGFVHNHTNEKPVPSCGDVAYGMQILRSINTVSSYHIPIFNSNDGVLHGYVISHDEREFFCTTEKVTVINQ